jgi:TRAP-type mannitol/chloroaromatic compound transport system substrate-binding protein
MTRRTFIKKAAAGAAAGIVAAPAIAQTNPTINWRLASSFPKSLDTIYGASEILAKRVAQLTDGKFNIRVFPGGEIVPALQVLDAVQAGTVEIGHSASYYYFGKDATFAFDTSIPFGMTSRQQTAWMDQGGGRQLMREFFHDYGIVNFMGGNTGCQMGGWFRKEVNSPQDASCNVLVWYPSKSLVATFIRHWKRALSMRRSGSVLMMTKSWDSTKSLLSTTPPVGGKPVRSYRSM